jgi:hypothetical protein
MDDVHEERFQQHENLLLPVRGLRRDTTRTMRREGWTR